MRGVKEMKEQIAFYEDKMSRLTSHKFFSNGDSGQDSLNAISLTAKGRVKHGDSQRVIEDFLKKSNGAGTTTQSVCDATSTKYGTVYRILTKLEKDGSVSRDGSNWKWSKPLTVEDF